MSKLSTLTSRGRFLGAAGALLLTTVVSALAPTFAGAEQITTRSLQLSSSAAGTVATGDPGSATNGEKVTYTFTFNPGTAGTLQSMSFMFCDTAFGYIDVDGVTPLPLNTPCANPGGFDASAAPDPTVTGVTGATSIWTVDNTVTADNVIKISAATGGTTSVSTPVTVTFAATALKWITNPDDTTYTNPNFENTFFSHIDTYQDAAWTTRVDDGTVASAITQSVAITAKVQETLKFSVGTNAAATNGVCDPLTQTPNSSPVLTLGDVTNGALSPTIEYSATSYARLSTNSANGTSIQYVGNTLKSGSNTIDPLTGGGASATGSEQFGLGVDTTVTGNVNLSDLTDLQQLAAGYDAASSYQFEDTENQTDFPLTFRKPQQLIASNDVVECGTVPVKYIANINPNTEAGVYRTSINYIAVPKY